jgi:TonB family protein
MHTVLHRSPKVMKCPAGERRKGLNVCALALSLMLIAFEAGAQQEAPEEQVVALYEAPVAVEQVPPRYPSFAARRGAEGWVEFNFMVSPEGRPYEIYVVDHAGDDAFVDAAKEALERTVYAPARVGGRPVDGSSRLRVEFVLEGASDGARPSFASRYRRFMSGLTDASEREAASALDDLEAEGILNNYEDARVNLARYSFALQYGAPGEQMDYLKAALGESVVRPDSESLLEEPVAREVRRNLAQLQLANAYLGEALNTLELMRLRGDEEGVELFREAADQLEVFKTNEVAYSVAGQIKDGGSWLISLFKTRFQFDDLAGTIEELKLRCERAYVYFDFDPDVQYSVSGAAGECTLEVVGDPGTTFTLVQAN